MKLSHRGISTTSTLAILALAALPAAIGVSVALRRTSDPILEVDEHTLTTMKLTSASGIGNLRPTVAQRGIRLEGSARAGSLLGMALAGNPFERPALSDRSGMVSLVTGSPVVEEVDLAFPSVGVPWVIGRTYNGVQSSSGSHHDSDGPQGRNWAQVSQPEIVFHDNADNALDRLYVIYGADRFVELRRYSSSSNTFKATNGANAVALFVAGATNEPDVYRVADPMGREWTFFGFDGDAGSAAGQLWKIQDAAGNVSFVGDATTGSTAISAGFSGGKAATAYDASDRRFTYAYSTIGGASRLTQVKVETKTGGTWTGTPTGVTEIGKVDYGYYSADGDSFGDAGDLRLVTITTPLTDSGVSSVRKKHYRYWEGSYNSSTNPGHPHTLKLILGFEGARQHDWQDVTFDDDFLTESTDNLKPYAEAYFEYNSSYQVNEAWFGGACGCSGAGAGTFEFTYETKGGWSGTSGYDNSAKTRTIVKEPTALWRTTLLDEVGQPLTEVRTDGDPAGTSPAPSQWVSHASRSSLGVLERTVTPAAVSSYSHSGWSVSEASGAGRVVLVSRTSSAELKGFPTISSRRVGSGGSAESESERTFTFTSVTPAGYDVALTRPAVASEITYPSGSAITTSHSYTWHSGTDSTWTTIAMESVTTTQPTVVTGNNGSGSANTEKRHFRKDGLVDFEKSADASITYHEYSHGQRSKTIEDADTSKTASGEDFNGITVPSGFSTTGSGAFHRKVTFAYDAQRRADTQTHVWGVSSSRVSKHYYSKLADGQLVALTYSDYESGGTPKYYGPVSYSVTHHGGRTTHSATVALTSNESTTALTGHIDEADADPITAMDLGTLVALSTSVYNKAGTQLDESRSYFSIPTSLPGTSGTHYDKTLYGYDDAGRRRRVKEAHGTITRTVYDANSRATERWIGTNDVSFAGGEASGTDTMVKVESNVYDSGSAGGNGLLTQRTAFVQDSTTDQRVTSYLYDSHNHLIVTVNPTAPHELRKVDRLGRSTAVALYSSSSGLDAADDPTSLATNRLALSETFYDEVGRVYKTVRHQIDASDGSDDDSMASLMWYDAEGRAIKSVGGEVTKTIYDRLGRATHRYVLAKDNDSAYADADDVAGDTVLEEHQTTYDGVKSDVVMSATIARFHSDTGGSATTGALDTNADTDALLYTASDVKGRIQIQASWYDRFGRVTDTVAYGTYGGSNFDRDGLSVPASSDTALKTSYSYGTDGRVKDVTDPNGIVMRTEYDAMGRKTKEIRNYVDGVPSGDGSAGSAVDDVTVLWTYSAGLMASMTADLPSGQTDQTTTYTYGTAKGVAAGDSKIATGHLLQKVTYPDDGGGDRGYVLYAYNAQGQVIWTEDQATNVLENVYDTAGRETARKVTTLASGFDGAVRRVERSYDSLGRAETVVQYDAASAGSATDGVKYTYDGWGALTKFEQDRNSAVGASGSVDDYEVSYTVGKSYGATSTNPGRRTLQRTAMVLPSGKSITLTYGGTPYFDDVASRVSQVKDGATRLMGYSYNGAGHVVEQISTEAAISTRVTSSTAGSYPGLDRYNRIVNCYWQKDLGTPRKFYDVAVTWDKNSNITVIDDAVHTGFDVQYTNDSINRLTKASEGTWSGSAITSKTREQEWTKLSHTGNWDREKLDLNGDGDYTDTDEHDDTRAHNPVNEMTQRSWGGNNYNATYDKNGNLTDDGKDYKYEWDAFNRLVRVKNQSNVLVEEYRYNGLGFRIGWHADSDSDGDVDSNDKWYYPAYDEAWRMVAVFRESDTAPKEEFVPHLAGADGFGGSSLLDGVILRYKDANTAWTSASDGTLEEKRYYAQNWRGDVVAIVSSAGAMYEWVKYSPYGIPFGMPAADTESDGDCDATDITQIQTWINGSAYDVRGDLDLDGDVDTTDKSTAQGQFSATTLALQALSALGSRRGFAGYEVSQAAIHLAHVRHRLADSVAGRWHSREPLGYRFGENLYEYVGCKPLIAWDSLGLGPNIVNNTGASGMASTPFVIADGSDGGQLPGQKKYLPQGGSSKASGVVDVDLVIICCPDCPGMSDNCCASFNTQDGNLVINFGGHIVVLDECVATCEPVEVTPEMCGGHCPGIIGFITCVPTLKCSKHWRSGFGFPDEDGPVTTRPISTPAVSIPPSDTGISIPVAGAFGFGG